MKMPQLELQGINFMIKISHRGNINGRIVDRENSPNYIDHAINNGFDVEIDVRWKYGLYLGHDFPVHKTSIEWLYKRRNSLWIHVKDIKAMEQLVNSPFRCFFHEKERHTIISNSKYIWTHDLSECLGISIIPLLSKDETILYPNYLHAAGICTDYPHMIGL
jgi:hypothetical protein